MTLLLLRKMRQSLIPGQNAKRYFLYALGEIVLIICGILVALAINNKSAQLKSERDLNITYELIANDLRADTTQFGYILRSWKQYDSLYKNIIDHKVTPTDYRTNSRYRGLLFGYPIVVMHQTGYNILLSSGTLNPSDTLAHKVLELYSFCNRFVPEMEKNMSDNVNRNMAMLSETQSWYSDVLSGKVNEDFITYVTNDAQYRNLINNQYIYIFHNYLNLLKNLNNNMSLLLSALEKRQGAG